MDTFWFSVNAVLPILILLSFGYILKRTGFINEQFLTTGNKFVFRIALPALLYYTIYSIPDFSDINWSVVVYSVIGVTILFVMGFFIALFTTKKENQRGVIWQGVYRANYAIIGIPLAEAIGGAEALSVVALCSAFVVPMINIYAVISLTFFVKDEESDMLPFKNTIIKIMKNPLIISILIGLITLWIRSLIPLDPVTGEHVFTIQNNLKFIYLAIKWVGQIASPFALIVLGGTFEFLAIRELAKQVKVGVISRVVFAPLIALSIAVLLSKYTSFFNFTSLEYPALIALFASPVAISSAVMAWEMKNDGRLAVQLVVWTTSMTIFSIFIIVFLFRSIGLL